MISEVSELIAALRNGTMGLDEVAARFRDRPWPRTKGPSPQNYLELASAAERDPEPFVPGSYDEVAAAYRRGEISRPDYRVLAQAAAESLGAEYGPGD